LSHADPAASGADRSQERQPAAIAIVEGQLMLGPGRIDGFYDLTTPEISGSSDHNLLNQS
jgi:hypothetical protein